MRFLRRKIHGSRLALGAIALILAGPTVNAAEPGQWSVELYGGWYFAGDLQKLNDIEGGLDDTIEALGIEPGDDLTFGVRAGRRQADNWGWELSLGKFDVDDAAERLERRAGIDISLWLLDLSLKYYPGGGAFFFYGGPGAAIVDLTIDSNDARVVDDSKTEVSGNLGLGYLFNVGESAFVRIDGKVRFYDADFYKGDPDAEMTAAIGWNL